MGLTRLTVKGGVRLEPFPIVQGLESVVDHANEVGLLTVSTKMIVSIIREEPGSTH